MSAAPLSMAGDPSTTVGRTGRPIRSWLRWLAVACIVPASLASLALILLTYDRGRRALDVSTVVAARAIMTSIDYEFARLRSALAVRATSRLLRAGDLGAFYPQAQALQRILGASNVVLVAPDGRQLLNTARPFDASLPVDGNPDKLGLVFTTGRAVVSNLFTGPATGKWLLAVEVPVVIEGVVAYGLGVGLSPDHFAPILAQHNLPSDWVVAIFDGNGRIAARSHHAQLYVGQTGAPELLERLRAAEEGIVEAMTLEGIAVISSFSRSPDTGWSVAIGIPRASFIGELQTVLWASAAGSALLLLLGAAVAHVIGRRIEREIGGLRRPALALASGQPVVAPRSNIREVSAIGQALSEASGLLARREADRMRADAAEMKVELADRVAERFRSLLEGAPDAMLVVDQRGRIRFANRRVETLLGFNPVELADRPIGFLLPERYLTAHDAHVASYFRAPVQRAMGLGMDLFARRKDGSEVPVDVSLSPFDMDGERCVMAALRDVTLRKQLEAGLEASRMQLMASARLAALGTMAGGIAHEINTPLAVIHALASDLVEDAERHEMTNESARDSAARIRDFAGRIARIIASMRQLAREGATDPLEPARVADIVSYASDVCAERFRNSAVTLTVDPIDPRVTIRCRAGQISQVLINLLQNAYDAVIDLEGDRWVRLATEADVDAVSISVVDSGGGVPEDLKLRIMEPFFTTKPPGKGTGLGLSVSRQIILDHDGSFEVTERDGNTCFTLRLPRATEG